MKFSVIVTAVAGLSFLSLGGNAMAGDTGRGALSAALEQELAAKHGEAQRARIHQGLRQIAGFWRTEDGDSVAMASFVRENFAGDQATLDTLFSRWEAMLEQLDGHMTELGRAFRTQADLDRGPLLPLDETFAGYDPSAHVIDDFFANKLAFVVLLNFPLTTLEERLTEGERWTRRQWAEARLAQRFSKRIPAEVSLAVSRAAAGADSYISSYNIYMHHVLDPKGMRLFPPGMRLLSHWNLRDQIKAEYADASMGPARQRTIQKVMERIVTQTIPAAVVNNPNVDWNPFTNAVAPAAVRDAGTPAQDAVSDAPEPDTRYATLLSTFRAAALADPYSPTAPTLIARRFDEDREIPEQRVKAMLVEVVSSPLVRTVAQMIGKRLGRPLEPFDIWYNGFRAGATTPESELDSIVARRYPTADAYRRDIPNLLRSLGFTAERAEVLAAHIDVDPARGSGHASGAAMRSANAHLRTRVEKGGMNYKGFNIAVHEMGHNVEQVFSLNMIDHTLLQGVPNTAFTEALAFVFQGHDRELLGLSAPDPRGDALKVLNDFWGTYEIAGVALVDMEVWHWMYQHPDATPAALKEATLGIARKIWNAYYASVFRTRDVVLLGIYSHMIDAFLYLPDYPLGHMIAHQIEEQVRKGGTLGAEFERMAVMGRVAPDLWMRRATGRPVGPEALLEATAAAVKKAEGR
jgi:hypothetical protein